MVGAISYTGWRLVCVMPYEIFTNKMADVKQFVLLILLLMAMMLVFVNRIISVRISRPIMKLDHSVREYQEGKEERLQSEAQQRSGIWDNPFRNPTGRIPN